jgi:hypothetical protein
VSLPVLWHIPVSHYNEKVRWAMELKGVAHERRAPVPPAHMDRLAAQLRHRQRTGMDSGQTPQSQGNRLVARQVRRLPCWFGRPAQPLDPAAPYDRAYTKHAPDHSDKDVPANRAQQAVEDRLISRGLARRPHACWDLPEQFVGDPGAPLLRKRLRALARLPHGYRGAVNDPHPHNGRRHMPAMDHRPGSS